MKKYLTILALISGTAFAQPAPQMADMSKMFFEHLDSNKDAKVSLQEFQKPTDMQFKAMDKNNDGSVDQAEFKEFNAKMMQRAQQMRQKMQQQR